MYYPKKGEHDVKRMDGIQRLTGMMLRLSMVIDTNPNSLCDSLKMFIIYIYIHIILI